MSKIDIFISYKKEERAHADRYERALIDAGYAVVTDLKIEEGKDFGDVIDGMIRAARLVLVVWTHASAQSEWVRKEAIEADRLRKYFPIALEAITPEEIPLQLRNVHWQDLSSKSPEAAVEDTIARIGEKIGFRGRDDGNATARSAAAEDDLAFFQVVKAIGELAGYHEYLRRYPKGVYVEDARRHLGWPARLRRKLPDTAWIIALTAIASVTLNHWSTPPDIQEAVAKVKTEVTKTLSAQHDRALKDTEKSHESAIAELKASHTQALQAQTSAVEVEKAAAVEAVQALETAKKAHESAIAELKASHAKALQAARAVAAARREVSTSSPAPSTLTGDARIAYGLASERIAQAQREGWTFLNLSGDETGYTFAGETRTGDKRLKALTMIPPEIEELTALQRLYLSGTQVADISALKGLTALQRLWLRDTQVSDISALKGLTAALQRLYLNGTQVADISALKGLTALQRLYLDKTQVADISALKGLTALQWLGLRNTQVADISALKGLTVLQKLWLQDTEVTDLSPLQNLHKLILLEPPHDKVAENRAAVVKLIADWRP